MGESCALFESTLLETMDYSSLECFKRHGISYNHPGDGLRMRPLEREDYEKGYITLLSQLTKVGDVSRLKFEQRFDEMKNNPGSYYIIVVEVRKYQRLGLVNF